MSIKMMAVRKSPIEIEIKAVKTDVYNCDGCIFQREYIAEDNLACNSCNHDEIFILSND